MKEIRITISKGQHLKDSVAEIPSNAILCKCLPGIGATTLEIETPRDSIIIVPNVPVIESKVKKHKQLMGVREDIKTEDIINFFNSQQQPYKIMTTPESFHKVKEACGECHIDIYEQFFCLNDESHKLIKDVSYRKDIVLPMVDFFNFKKKALVSATPLNFSDPRFEENGFFIINVVPNFDYRQEITVLHTNNIFQAIKELVADSKPLAFFTNSIDMIISIIKQLGLSENSCVFCAPKSKVKLKTEYSFNSAYIGWEPNLMKQYSFFTDRFFNAFDLEIKDKANVVMVTDTNTTYTMIDVETDCIQIAGRFRNGIESLIHIYNTDSRIESFDSLKAQQEIKAHEHAYNVLNTYYNSATTEAERRAFGEARDSLPFNKYLYTSGSKNHFAIDRELHDREVKSRYANKELVEKSYIDSHFFYPTFVGRYFPVNDCEQLKILSPQTTIKDRRKIAVNLMDSFTTPYTEAEQNAITEIRQLDPFIVEAYETLGRQRIEELKYNQKAMQEEMILASRKGNKAIQLIKVHFILGVTYTNGEIVKGLTRIFDMLHIRSEQKISGKMICDYFVASPTKKKGNRGYLLLRYNV